MQRPWKNDNNIILLYHFYELGSLNEMEPIHLNSRTFFNFTSSDDKNSTDTSYNLEILLKCDYSTQLVTPIEMASKVSVFMNFVGFLDFIRTGEIIVIMIDS